MLFLHNLDRDLLKRLYDLAAFGIVGKEHEFILQLGNKSSSAWPKMQALRSQESYTGSNTEG